MGKKVQIVVDTKFVFSYNSNIQSVSVLFFNLTKWSVLND